MSFLASLPAKLHPGKTALYVVGGLLLAAVGWWLLAPSGHSPQTAVGRPSALRRIAQRVTGAPPTPKLQISDVQQNGQIVEIRGTADCDAAVMINGERVPLIFDHCGFKHFVLLPQGPSTIAITAQGSAGGVNTQLIKVNVE